MTLHFSKLGAGFVVLSLVGCANGAWQGAKTYAPPPTNTISLTGFNVNADVALLPSGNLPITFSRAIVNNGQTGMAAGYTLREEIILTILAARGGAAAFQVTNRDRQTVFRCERPGPAIPAGGSATVSFTVPGPGCRQLNPASPPAATLPALPCGLYREVLTIDADNDIAETNESDNVAVHYFHVPSLVRTLTINTQRNPTGNPRVTPGPGPDDVAVRFDVMPSPVVTHRHTINASPPGSTFIARAPTPVVSRVSGDRLSVAPMPVGTLPNGVAGPQVVRVMVAPNRAYVGPLTDILRDASVDRIVSSITAITTDGCLVRQAGHPVSIVHPAR